MKKSYSHVDVNNVFLTEAAQLLTGFSPSFHTLSTELFTIARLHGTEHLARPLFEALSCGWRAAISGEPSADLATKLRPPPWPDDELHSRFLHKGHALGAEIIAKLMLGHQHITSPTRHSTQ